MTICQGITMAAGDIYDTKEEAQAELKDLHQMRVDSCMDPEDDFAVIEIVQKPNGSWEDTFGAPIELIGENS